MFPSVVRSQKATIFISLLPVVCFFYAGLFITLRLWYPEGLSTEQFNDRLLNFSVIYVLWLVAFYSYKVFDWDFFEGYKQSASRLFLALGTSFLIAVVYFYFQPTLLITPRRFLLVHMAWTGLLAAGWFGMMQYFLSKKLTRLVFLAAPARHLARAEKDRLAQLAHETNELFVKDLVKQYA